LNPFFVFFFLSGFSSLVYQVVWLRVAMAGFGVTTALISVVLSVFMAGLALGSWGGGRLVRRFQDRPPGFHIRMYGLCELAIGISGLAVTPLLRLGHSLLAGGAQWGSFGYYLASAGWIALVILPFCAAMGATFPFAMAGIRASRSFSYLYVANVLGAMAGTLGSAFVLIELLGFERTVQIAAAVNAVIAASAFLWGRPPGLRGDPPVALRPKAGQGAGCGPGGPPYTLPLLFTSGAMSLGMEVVWTRQFVPFLGPVVYAFAIMLAVYLAATAAGSRLYRAWSSKNTDPRTVALLAGCCALLPLFAADPRIAWQHRLAVGALRILCGVGVFCGVLGFLTPMLVDRWSEGDPDRAGRAYAVNALGCIAGPLLAGIVLLPAVGERLTLILLALPFLAFGFSRLRLLAAVAAVWLLLIGLTRDFETLYLGAIVRRDHTATVIAAGQGMDRKLLVNGMGITSLTAITKMMVHLPLASLERPPERVLVLCFGMGTSFRSALAWGVDVTAVDLVPGVPPLIGFFHRDGEALLGSPRAHVVIDDARRFLERTRETFDAIVIDPPPPMQAAGSSLLYSTEFYAAAVRRLRPDGILQQWIPGAEPMVASAVYKALRAGFPHVRTFPPVEGVGLHFLASRRPIPAMTAAQLASRVPPAAAADMIEWGPAATPAAQFDAMLHGAAPAFDEGAPALTDDRPVNEYYFLRKSFRR
jgi:spermidine synthase